MGKKYDYIYFFSCTQKNLLKIYYFLLRQELRKSGPSIENAVKWKEARTRMKRIFRMYRNLEKKNLFKKLQDKFRQNPFTAIKEELQKEDPQPPSLDIPEEKILEHFKNNYA